MYIPKDIVHQSELSTVGFPTVKERNTVGTIGKNQSKRARDKQLIQINWRSDILEQSWWNLQQTKLLVTKKPLIHKARV